MLMMDWCTAVVSKKRRPSRRSFKPAWRNAVWKCIRRKPKSSTAKTGTVEASTRTSNLSSSAMKDMREAIRDLNLRRQTQLSLQDIARQLNPLLRGWIGYYGRYAPSALYPLLRYVNHTLVAWALRKFKRFNGHKTLASRFLERLAKERPDLFVHWQSGMVGVFA